MDAVNRKKIQRLKELEDRRKQKKQMMSPPSPKRSFSFKDTLERVKQFIMTA